jgi:hypothetical protein
VAVSGGARSAGTASRREFGADHEKGNTVRHRFRHWRDDVLDVGHQLGTSVGQLQRLHNGAPGYPPFPVHRVSERRVDLRDTVGCGSDST